MSGASLSLSPVVMIHLCVGHIARIGADRSGTLFHGFEPTALDEADVVVGIVGVVNVHEARLGGCDLDIAPWRVAVASDIVDSRWILQILTRRSIRS